MAFLVLASLTVLLLGTSHGELMQEFTQSHKDGKPTEQPVPGTRADGKPCEPTGGEGETDSCQSSTSKPSISSVEKAFSTTKDVISIDTKATENSFPTPCSLQHFILLNCNSTCDSDICTDSGNYESIMCNDASSQCAFICAKTLQKYPGNCFVNSESTDTTTTSNDINRFLISTSPLSSAPLSLTTIIITITVMAVVLILALLIIIIVTLWLVFRYKTKTIQQRYKESPNEERYVRKELSIKTTGVSKDHLYDTIDETSVGMPGHQTTSFTTTTQPSPTTPAQSHTRYDDNKPAPAPSDADKRIYLEGTPPSDEDPQPYTEPVCVQNLHLSSSNGQGTSLNSDDSQNCHSTHPQWQPKNAGPQFSLQVPTRTSVPALISDDYTVLGPEGALTEQDDNKMEAFPIPTASVDNTHKELMVCNTNNTITAEYAVLEGPTCITPDPQPYECPVTSSAMIQTSTAVLNSPKSLL